MRRFRAHIYLSLTMLVCCFAFANTQASDQPQSIDNTITWMVGQITWSGQTVFAEEEMSALLGFNQGDIYSRTLIEKSTKYQAGVEKQVQNLFMDKGYLFAQLDVEEFYIGNQINLDIKVDLGPQIVIKNIYFQGAGKKGQKQLLSQITTTKGDHLSRKALVADQDFLYQNGLVVSNLQIDTDEKNSTAVLIFQLNERKHYPALLTGE